MGNRIARAIVAPAGGARRAVAQRAIFDQACAIGERRHVKVCARQLASVRAHGLAGSILHHGNDTGIARKMTLARLRLATEPRFSSQSTAMNASVTGRRAFENESRWKLKG